MADDRKKYKEANETESSGKDAEENRYSDILTARRPPLPANHPPMDLQDRAKIFAPFAALRGHSDRLTQETGKLLRMSRPELSAEEAEILNVKLSQAEKGMTVTVFCYQAESVNASSGYCVSLSGQIRAVDTISRSIQLATGEMSEKGEVRQTIKFDDILDISGDGIVDISAGF
ncbi:MAG: YolD-like family protein [Lachnospiraceae bacterium]|nr:YolD-like family protein [Lachnospiraceae bacterium]